jgi:hypothetical protein
MSKTIWHLGRHQLLCGDACIDNQGQTVDLVLADPPFDMNAEQVRDAIAPLSQNFIVAGYGVEYHRICTLRPFCYQFEVASQRIKPQSLPGRQKAQILHWNNAFLTLGYPHCFDLSLAGGYFPSVLPPCNSEIQGSYAKPLPWAIDLLKVCHAHTIADPFAGTGTVLIACEKLGKICYATEKDPRLCQLIIQRWENATGQKARLQS